MFPVWKRAEGRHNVQPLEQLFEASLPDVQVRLSEFAGELVDFSYRDRLGLLSAEELSRWSDVLLEAVLFCGRCRAFVERVCGGDFALFLFQEGGYFSREEVKMKVRVNLNKLEVIDKEIDFTSEHAGHVCVGVRQGDKRRYWGNLPVN